MMTAQKSFKRLVRARMAKTGESYTTARSHLLAGPPDQPTGEEVPQLVCSDDRIRERTGRGWEEWFELLDSWNAEEMSHTDISRRLGEFQGLDPRAWNVQAVVTSFERARGRRAVGQRVGADGWVAGASRTIAADAETLLMAFVDPVARHAWLGGLELTERSVNKPVSARFDVGDGRTRLLVTAADKGPGRATVAVEQSRLADAEERETQKAFWRTALTDLKAELEGRGR